LFTEGPPLIQQLGQDLVDACFPEFRCRLQEQHVLAVGTPQLLCLQRIIGPAKGHRRIQVFPVHVACERPRLAHQPVDHVPIVDAVFGLAAQPLHRLHQRTRVPHLDDFGTDPRFHPLSPQPCRHRIDVLLHLDGAALAHPRPLTFQRLQPPGRQRPQLGLLRCKRLDPVGIPPILHGAHQPPVFLATCEVAATTQQELLFQRFLEAAMPLFAIAILVAARRIGRLGRHAIVTHQGLVASGVLLRVTVLMNRQRHAIRSMPFRYPAQFPQSVLQPFAQAGKALRETQRHVLPVRARQDEVVKHVRKGFALDGHAQAVQVREVRRAQPAWFMNLGEKHFLGRPMLSLPLPHAPFDGSPVPLPVLSRTLTLQPSHQRFGLQARLAAQQFFQPCPNRGERIRTCSPGVRPAGLAGQLALLPIFACGFTVHACLHRCPAQRSSLVQLASQFFDLRVGHLASCSHRNSLC
jgi:hypothetical protein